MAALALALAGHPWLGIVAAAGGAAGYAALVVRDLFDPDLIRRVHGLPDQPKLPPTYQQLNVETPLALNVQPDSLESEEHRKLLADIQAGHEAIRGQLLDGPPMIRGTLRDTYQRCSDMVRAAEPLAVRGAALSNYLSQFEPTSLHDDAEGFETSAADAADSRARAGFSAAAAATRRHLETYRDVAAMHETVTARLCLIRAALRSVEAHIVKLTACQASVAESANPTIEELSSALHLDIGSLQSGVSEVTDPV